MQPIVTVRLKILLAITGLLVGGLLLFSSGSNTRNTVNQPKIGLPQTQGIGATIPSKVIATPFTEPLNTAESQRPPDSNATLGNIIEEAMASSVANDLQQTPLQLIDAYMTAWSGNNRSEIDALWTQISQCPECLQRIKELLMNQGVPKGMLLELTYRIVRLGNPSMLPVFDYLLQPSVDLNIRIILTQQMITDGRDMYVKKLFDILQQADLDGYRDYAEKHTWMISKLKNPGGIAAIFDVVSGRSGASERFAAHVQNVFNNTLLGIKQKGMTGAMVDYYLTADETVQEKLWGIMSLHAQSLVALSKEAYQKSGFNQFKKYSETLASISSIDAIEGELKLVSEVDYPQEYFIDMIRTSARRFNNLETLHKLEDYMRNPHLDMRTRLTAAEGLLAVKDSAQARYILEKVLRSSRYEDSEIIAYISARL